MGRAGTWAATPLLPPCRDRALLSPVRLVRPATAGSCSRSEARAASMTVAYSLVPRHPPGGRWGPTRCPGTLSAGGPCCSRYQLGVWRPGSGGGDSGGRQGWGVWFADNGHLRAVVLPNSAFLLTTQGSKSAVAVALSPGEGDPLGGDSWGDVDRAGWEDWGRGGVLLRGAVCGESEESRKTLELDRRVRSMAFAGMVAMTAWLSSRVPTTAPSIITAPASFATAHLRRVEGRVVPRASLGFESRGVGGAVGELVGRHEGAGAVLHLVEGPGGAEMVD